MNRIPAATRRNMVRWLGQGISPRRLALTLALGFAVGCIPVFGIPTALCAALALALRLNLPAIQAANYAAMPLQLALIVPFVRMGGWLVSVERLRFLVRPPFMHVSAFGLAGHVSGLAGQALLAWLIVAVPTVVFLTFLLTAMLRRIPAMRSAEAGD